MSRGLTQGELARQAVVTLSYISRLENGGAAPGIDLVARLSKALGTTVADLLPAESPPDTADVLRHRAQRLFDAVVPKADRETLQLLVPFLARLADSWDCNSSE
jgi:transcriptional regulator with XRE-family HTH domain